MPISITINAESAAELKQELLVLALANVSLNTPTAPNQGVEGAELVTAAAVSEENDPNPPERPKRTRRTKAQIAAEKAAETETVEAAPEEEVPAATLQDVNKAMAALMETGSAGGSKMIDLLTDLGARDESGAIKTKFLDKASYGEAIERANAMTAEAEAKSTENVLG